MFEFLITLLGVLILIGPPFALLVIVIGFLADRDARKRTAVLARCEQQHQWILADDDARGFYGPSVSSS